MNSVKCLKNSSHFNEIEHSLLKLRLLHGNGSRTSFLFLKNDIYLSINKITLNITFKFPLSSYFRKFLLYIHLLYILVKSTIIAFPGSNLQRVYVSLIVACKRQIVLQLIITHLSKPSIFLHFCRSYDLFKLPFGL